MEQVLKVPSSVSAEVGKITAPMAEADKVTDLLIALRESGVALLELSVQKPTLDEVFLTLTGHGVEGDTADTDVYALKQKGVIA
ncbi:hypothetical protein D3C76_1743020 [compost metagenome]